MRIVWLTFLFVTTTVSFVAVGQGVANLPPDTVKFIRGQEKLVRDVAEYATELHSQRRELVKNCTCSMLDCTNVFEGECVSSLTTPDVCTNADGRLVNFSATIVRIPGEMNPVGLTSKMKENICAYKHMQNRAEQFGRNEWGWIYLGTTEGDFRRWPATPFWRGEPDGNPNLGGCRQYDPRVRPWFIAASTGPKDVVILVDRSESMGLSHNRGTRERSRWNVAKDAVNRILDTFSQNDFLSVVPFSDTAVPISDDSKLMRATIGNRELIKQELENVEPDGTADPAEAFKTAFRLLEDSCADKGKQCSNCQKIILFFTDGEFGGVEEAWKPSEINKLIARFQKRLETREEEKATIFTYSITNQANDCLPRHIACSNDGIWSLLGGSADPLEALRSYFAHIADGRQTDDPVWIEPYEDAGGLGTVTTVAIPFYSRASNGEPPTFLGVVGHDVGLHEFLKFDVTAEQVLEAIIKRSPSCTPSQTSSCQLQSNRNIHGSNSLCLRPDSILSQGNQTCYHFDGRVYKHFSQQVSRGRAALRCRRDGGQLVSIRNGDELKFVTRLASVDGSWTGAKYATISTFSWPNSSVPELSLRSEFWATNEPRVTTSDLHCAAIDTRGTAGNLFSLPCSNKLSYICEYESDASCAGEVEDAPTNSNCPALNASLMVEEDTSEGARLNSSDVLCDIGEPKSSEEVMCCRAPTQTQNQTQNQTESTQLQPVYIVFLTLGCIGAVLAIAGLVYHSGVFKPRK